MLAIDDPTHWTFTIFPEMRKYIDEHDKQFQDYFPQAQNYDGRIMLSKVSLINTLVKEHNLNINVREIDDLMDLLGIAGPTHDMFDLLDFQILLGQYDSWLRAKDD